MMSAKVGSPSALRELRSLLFQQARWGHLLKACFHRAITGTVLVKRSAEHRAKLERAVGLGGVAVQQGERFTRMPHNGFFQTEPDIVLHQHIRSSNIDRAHAAAQVFCEGRRLLRILRKRTDPHHHEDDHERKLEAHQLVVLANVKVTEHPIRSICR